MFQHTEWRHGTVPAVYGDDPDGCLVPGLMLAKPAVAGETLPCEVMVKFEDDEVGAATIYRLRLQFKNRTGRDITHVGSDDNRCRESVGNSQLDCRVDDMVLKPGTRASAAATCR